MSSDLLPAAKEFQEAALDVLRLAQQGIGKD